MKLRELEGEFIALTPGERSFRRVETLAEADGVMFLCPHCFVKNGGKVGTHIDICWFRDRGVPDDVTPNPGRWTPSGTGLDDLTFVPGNPPMAISVKSGDEWHVFVENGEVNIR